MRLLVHRFAAGLMSLGLGRGDRAALISEGRREWIVSELGILYTGAVNVPISVKVDELGDLKFRLAHSGCRLAIVSRSQAAKIRQVRKDLPELALTVVLDELSAYDVDEIPATEVLRRGEEFLKTRRKEFEAAYESLKESDYANICYTSGTTADPKGIILTHRNYTANIDQGRALVDCPEQYVSLIILPWDHAFAHTCGIYSLMKSGAAMASVELGKTPMETLRNIPRNIKETRPHILLSVPALAKNFRKSIEKGVREKGPKVEALFEKALKLAVDYNAEGWNKGRGAKKLKKPLYALYDKLLFGKIRENFGGRLEFFVGGGSRRRSSSGSWTTRTASSSPARPERSSSAARTSWPGTGKTRRRRARPSETAGSTRGTSAISTPTVSSSSSAKASPNRTIFSIPR